MTDRRGSSKHQCQGGGRYAAKFEYRGRWKSRADHDLCPRCYRSQRDRDLAREAVSS